MSGLNIYVSNRMEVLAEKLALIIREHPLATVEPEIIIVQSRGMERWVSMEIARQNGICANISFPFPNAFLEDLLKKANPELPDVSIFEPEVMVFRIMELLPEIVQNETFGTLKAYIEDDPKGLKRYQLAVKLADLYDQYLVFRPEMIADWEAGRDGKNELQRWQAQLWRKIIRDQPHHHRARLHQNFLNKITGLKLTENVFPERVSIFGISYLPLFHLNAFAVISRLVQVDFFLLNPSKEYWGDIVSDHEIHEIQKRYSSDRDALYLERGNRLLASLGALGRDFFDMLNNFDYNLFEHFMEPTEETLLAMIQSDMLRLHDREKIVSNSDDPVSASEAMPVAEMQPTPVVSAADDSIQMHSCHSPMREIEALHDNLLAMFEKDPELQPRDIIVMTPDIETYSPYVQAVFGGQTNDALRIPFSLADQNVRQENRVIDGFLSILEIRGSRFEAARVIRFLEYPDLRNRFGLIESDVPLIESWVNETQIRWGIDNQSRLKRDLPDFADNTWSAGINRLLLGYAMPGHEQHMYAGILPYDHVEGAETRILGKFIEFVSRLFQIAESLDESRALLDWRHHLSVVLDTFFLADEESEREHHILRQVFEELAERATVAAYDEALGIDIVTAYLRNRLEKRNYGAGFLSTGVTFCAMLPMRSIPFKIVCLVGMNNNAFPRDEKPLTFDLIAANPKAGDRSHRKDDKYLFLESILSARQKLYISYVGQSIQDNSRIPPSALVSELLDAVAIEFGQGVPDFQNKIITHHPLQAFSPKYFSGETDLFSYSQEDMLAGSRLNEQRDPSPFISGPLSMSAEEVADWETIDCETLSSFFTHPARFLLNKRLGVILGESSTVVDEHEHFQLDSLEKYQIGEQLLMHRLSGAVLREYWPVQRATGKLPPGIVGELAYAELSNEVENYANKYKDILQGPQTDFIEVDIEICGFQLRDRLAFLPEEGMVIFRFAKTKAKDLIRTWIRHLLFCACAGDGYQRKSCLICKDEAWFFETETESQDILSTLLEIFRVGLTKPIPFFPETSREYFQKFAVQKCTREEAMRRALQKWKGNDYYIGEADDTYNQIAFESAEPFGDEFEKHALTIFQPLFARCQAIC